MRACLLLVVLFLLARSVPAESREVVVLVRPKATAVELQEAFNRLQGELSLHGFSVVVVDGSEVTTSEALEDQAERGKAVASVAFVGRERGKKLAAVDIWISDRVTGKTTKRTIYPERGQDAPSVLALRALELLRASLREYEPGQPPKKDVAGAHPDRAKRVVTRMSEERSAPKHWFVSAGGLVATSFPDGSPAGGPLVALAYRRKWWGLRVAALGPTVGGHVTASEASFDYLGFVPLFEPAFLPYSNERWSVQTFGSVGPAYLQVTGKADMPFAGRADTAWLVAAGGGISAALNLGSRLALWVAARGLVLLPQPSVTVGSELAKLGTPVVVGSAGIQLSL